MVTTRDDWRNAPPYWDGGEGFTVKYRAQCYCGAVGLEVSADPVDAKHCHCPQCQSLHGAPFQWAVIFHKTDVRFVRGVDKIFFYNAETGRPGHVLPCKLSCGECRSPIADEGRRTFEATCHIFYGMRVVDVNDHLPKFLGHKDLSPLWGNGQSEG
jgi:hypothetical protein